MMFYSETTSYSTTTSESSMPECDDVIQPRALLKMKEKNLLQRSQSTDSRRDSDDSNDSQKKPASLNEIQDLYTALQDLVKTNVTVTPISDRNHKVISPSNSSPSSCNNSPRVTNSPNVGTNSPKVMNNKINNKLKKRSKEETKYNNREMPQKNKRGMSVGTLEVVTNLLKKSPFPSRKMSHEIESTDGNSKANNKAMRKTARSKSEINCNISKDSYEKEQNSTNTKKWRLNIFKRNRTKSEPDSTDNGDEDAASSDGNESLLSAETSSLFGSDKSSSIDSKFISQNVDDIDQLVAALNLECPQTIQPAVGNNSPKSIDPESELNKLESWFEKAAAEAVMYASQQDLLSCDSNTSKSNRRKSNGAGIRRPSTIKRGPSIGQKDRRRRSKPLDLPKHSPLSRVHAQSTPNLREHLNNQEDFSSCNSNKEITKMDIFTENNLKEENKNDNSPFTNRKVSLDDGITRLPKSPLFYMPSDTKINETCEKPTTDTNTDVISLEYENGLQPSPRTIERMKREKSLEVKVEEKQSNTDLEEINKNRAIFTQEYFEKYFLRDEKSFWSSTSDKRPDNVRNSLHLDTGIQTDDNDNYRMENDNYFKQNEVKNSVHITSLILDDYQKENGNKSNNIKYVMT